MQGQNSSLTFDNFPNRHRHTQTQTPKKKRQTDRNREIRADKFTDTGRRKHRQLQTTTVIVRHRKTQEFRYTQHDNIMD